MQSIIPDIVNKITFWSDNTTDNPNRIRIFENSDKDCAIKLIGTVTYTRCKNLITVSLEHVCGTDDPVKINLDSGTYYMVVYGPSDSIIFGEFFIRVR